jgi:putative addiction module killer protein
MIIKSSVYQKWIDNLNDERARHRILVHVRRLESGNPSDSKSIGEGISEMRIHYGPGYRVYYKDTGNEIIILLCGGDKSTQEKDITKARRIASDYDHARSEE